LGPRARHRVLDRLGGVAADERLELGDDFAARRFLSEGGPHDRDGDDHDRGERNSV
jgi:hypothetical protein